MRSPFPFVLAVLALCARTSTAQEPAPPPSDAPATPPDAPAPPPTEPPAGQPPAGQPPSASPATPSEMPREAIPSAPVAPQPNPTAPPTSAFPAEPSAAASSSWTQTPLPPTTRPAEPAMPPSSERAVSPVPRPWTASGSLDEGPEPRQRDESHGLFGPLRIGPVLGAGLPSLLSIGGTLKITRYFGAGVNVGIIPQTKIAYYGDATLSYQEYDAYARIYPFGGGFFLGAGVGYAHARGTLKLADLPFSVEVNSEGSVQTLVATPQLGYFHIFESGFSAGFDLGAQIPLSASDIELETTISGSSIPPAAMPIVAEHLEANDARVRDTLETIGRTPLPTINFRIGWML